MKSDKIIEAKVSPSDAINAPGERIKLHKRLLEATCPMPNEDLEKYIMAGENWDLITKFIGVVNAITTSEKDTQ